MAMLQATGKPTFVKPHIIRYDAECFTIHNRDTFLYSACCHYTRVPRELWRDRLTKLKQAGFNTIETYVFWNYHEPVEGQVDMSLFEEFLEVVREMGLWLIARVGPYVCAEWHAGGFPDWIIAKLFPLRSDHPESIRTSLSWYNHVLPIVRKNMITRGGPVILVQIENEYDFWNLPNAPKLKYMTVLAESAWKHGIDVPLITNWCRQARENSDPVMAQIMDTCDFYPRWDVVGGTVPELDKLRKQEPTSPVSIAELQGGWFSQFGGLLSVDQEGVSGAQFNSITKTVIENAATYFSVYMGHGGTNFDWAARGLTTTYDYAAPLREPGGLWDKYYAAHRLGAFLRDFGPLVVRAKNVTDAVTSGNHHVSASLRAKGNSGVLFVRNNSDSPQSYSLKLTMPGVSGQPVQVPHKGRLNIARRDMKLLPVNLSLPAAKIHYCTAEILTQGTLSTRSYLAVYDDPNNLVEIAIHATHPPAVDGEILYQHYDAANQQAILGFRMDSVQKHLLVNGKLQIIALPRELANRTWSAELQAGSNSAVMQSPVITDSVLLRNSTHTDSTTNLHLEYAPGEHNLTILEHAPLSSCTVDGKPTRIRRDPHSRTASIAIHTPALPAQPVVITEGEAWVESFSPSHGKWISTHPVPLETLGQLPYSYVKYRAHFNWNHESKLFLKTLTEDEKQVFLNGKQIPELSRPGRSLSTSLAACAKPGSNLLEISYECFGSPNGGTTMEELKGISDLHIGDDQAKSALSGLQVQMASPAMEGRRINPGYSSSPWRKTRIDAAPGVASLVPAYTWFRSRFTIAHDSAWFSPLKVCISADRDALIYVNGRFVGFYRTIGPQSEFYLPEPFLHIGTGQENIVTVRLAYTNAPGSLKQLTIEPFREYAARKTQVQLNWKS
jgi:hypothetical protein